MGAAGWIVLVLYFCLMVVVGLLGEVAGPRFP